MNDNKEYYSKYFVKETKSVDYSHMIDNQLNSREEYDRVISTVSSQRKHRYKRFLRPKSSCKQSDVTEDINVLLKTITNEDFKSVQSVIKGSKFNFNGKDVYQWTPLMCACHRGDISIVDLLLKNGSKILVKDYAGNSPLSIAKQCKHDDIVELLLRETNSKRMERSTDKILAEDKEIQSGLSDVELSSEDQEIICISDDSDEEQITIFCDICDVNILDKEYTPHVLSTVHQFNKQLDIGETGANNKHVNYTIPENNKGFQLLLKSGWVKYTGLGRNQSGRKLPIKAKSNSSRQGVGTKSSAKNIHKIRPECNINFNYKLKKEINKKKEIQFRNELS